MNNVYRAQLVIAASCLISAGHARVGSADSAEWSLDSASGDYVIERLVDGQLQTARFTPSTYVTPRIAVRIDTVDADFSYVYEIANGSDSRQPIRTCRFVVASQALISATPPEWIPSATPTSNAVAWVKLDRGGALGIAPGDAQDGFALRASSLPGVSEARCRGRIAAAGVPIWLSLNERRQLEQLVAKDFVSLSVIAPVIAVAGSDLASLLGRVRSHYATHLETLPPANRQTIINAIVRIESTIRKQVYEMARADIRRLTPTFEGATQDAWTSQVLTALGVCLEYVSDRLEAEKPRE